MNELNDEIIQYLKQRANRLYEQGKISKEKLEQKLNEYDQGKVDGTMFIDTVEKLIEYATPWDLVNLYKSDVEFLISRLQIAEEALSIFADMQNWMGKGKYDESGFSGICEWDGDGNPVVIARKALEQIGTWMKFKTAL